MNDTYICPRYVPVFHATNVASKFLAVAIAVRPVGPMREVCFGSLLIQVQ